MTQQTALQLIPATVEQPYDRKISLDILPQDSELTGDPPDASFVASVKNFGLLEPILAAADNGKFKVLAGRRRVKAARAAGLVEVPARVYPAGWALADIIALIENEQRSVNVTSDLLAIEQLIAKGANVRDISVAVGMPTGTIRSRMKLLRLVPRLRAALEAGTIRGSIALELSQLPSHAQEILADKMESGEKIHRDDIRKASQARVASSMADLAGVLFSTPGADTETEQPRRTAADSLREALDSLPDDTPASYVTSLKKLTAWAEKRLTTE
jgi:ParB/RepB/Spo0J family partition protein